MSDRMESECLQNNATEFIFNISNFTVNCTAAQIYMTSGIHKLQGDLAFTDYVEEVHIKGVTHGFLKSTVECSKNAGIKFSENRETNQVLLSNLTVSFTSGTPHFKTLSS